MLIGGRCRGKRDSQFLFLFLRRVTRYSVRVIDTDEKLAAYLPVVRAADWVALDTEADSLHAYPEKVCLIQISTEAGDRLIDPLAGIDVNALLDALGAHALIMHGADYDLRLLLKHHKFVPDAIFDTMLAARLLGYRQFGLSFLVEHYLEVKLEKGSQKANWARRPLTERMEEYARNDTHYLKPLADKLKHELKNKGRLAWHEESCARLIEECTQPRPLDMDSVWRLKGSHALSRPALAILRELWKWREDEAVGANRPPFFILQHEKLIEIAAVAGAHRDFRPVLPRHLSERRRNALLKAIEKGLRLSVEKHPDHIRRVNHRPTEAERRRYAEIEKRRDARATKLDIDPTLIASRTTISELARDWNKHAPCLMDWQRELLEPAH
jgi:ribonuclease D